MATFFASGLQLIGYTDYGFTSTRPVKGETLDCGSFARWYLDLFMKPLPEGNYRTLVASTGGHWTISLFEGLWEDKEPYHGMDKLLDFFGGVTKEWAKIVQNHLDADWERQKAAAKVKGGRPRKRRAVIRASTSGHEDCGEYKEPWVEEVPMKWGWFNWPYIKDFNRIFQASDFRYTTFLPQLTPLCRIR